MFGVLFWQRGHLVSRGSLNMAIISHITITNPPRKMVALETVFVAGSMSKLLDTSRQIIHDSTKAEHKTVLTAFI